MESRPRIRSSSTRYKTLPVSEHTGNRGAAGAEDRKYSVVSVAGDTNKYYIVLASSISDRRSRRGEDATGSVEGDKLSTAAYCGSSNSVAGKDRLADTADPAVRPTVAPTVASGVEYSSICSLEGRVSGKYDN